MQSFAVVMRRVLIVLVLIGIAWGVAANYSYVFAKVVRGEVLEVERVTQPTAVIAGRGTISAEVMYSFAVMIRNSDSEIYSASSEDRQWAVVRKGHCVEARFYPYPPWDMERANTYFNARLLKVYDCPAGLPKANSEVLAVPPTVPPTVPAAVPPSAVAPSVPATVPAATPNALPAASPSAKP